jgi:D-alanyl-D-alanine carboxypeptidase
MKDHAHLYGFILRYQKGKEDISGYKYEPWHYRYVGKEIAATLYSTGMTYDEYAALYLIK